jgi:NADH:ubiquinone oxidoreductase subunit 6 (subunit J)
VFQADTRSIGVAMFERYIFPFEMVSILLLAAIVGALLLSARAGLPPKQHPEVAP